MKKDIIIIIVILIIIFAGEISTKVHLKKTSNELIEKLEQLKEDTIQAKQNNDREKIREEIKEIEEKWDKTNSIWALIVMHQELDNVEQPLTRAKSNIENGGLENALQEIETVIFFVEHVKQREELNWKNIF